MSTQTKQLNEKKADTPGVVEAAQDAVEKGAYNVSSCCILACSPNSLVIRDTTHVIRLTSTATYHVHFTLLTRARRLIHPEQRLWYRGCPIFHR